MVDDNDVRSRRAGDPGILERMDEGDESATAFARAVRHNIMALYGAVLMIAEDARDGAQAKRREEELRTMLLGPVGERERDADQGGILGRLEDKVDSMTSWLRWGISTVIGIAAAAGGYVTLIHH